MTAVQVQVRAMMGMRLIKIEKRSLPLDDTILEIWPVLQDPAVYYIRSLLRCKLTTAAALSDANNMYTKAIESG